VPGVPLLAARRFVLLEVVGTGAEGGGLHDTSYLPDDAYVATVADALIAGYCAALLP